MWTCLYVAVLNALTQVTGENRLVSTLLHIMQNSQVFAQRDTIHNYVFQLMLINTHCTYYYANSVLKFVISGYESNKKNW